MSLGHCCQRACALVLPSAGAVELRNSIQDKLGTEVPATLSFDYPTISELAKFLASTTPRAAPEALARGTDTETQQGGSKDRAHVDAELQQIVAGMLGRPVPSDQPLMEAGLDSLGRCPLADRVARPPLIAPRWALNGGLGGNHGAGNSSETHTHHFLQVPWNCETLSPATSVWSCQQRSCSITQQPAHWQPTCQSTCSRLRRMLAATPSTTWCNSILSSWGPHVLPRSCWLFLDASRSLHLAQVSPAQPRPVWLTTRGLMGCPIWDVCKQAGALVFGQPCEMVVMCRRTLLSGVTRTRERGAWD